MTYLRKFITKGRLMLVCTLAMIVLTLSILTSPLKQFRTAIRSITLHSNSNLFTESVISTYPPDQPLFVSNITSSDINNEVVAAYRVLSSKLLPVPVTYYSDSVDMPTQETIWQYEDYFVRLYVTSSLDSDGASINVFSGSYKDFRKDRLSESTDSARRFSPITFQAPESFLSNR
jgi:hypothetical protein